MRAWLWWTLAATACIGTADTTSPPSTPTSTVEPTTPPEPTLPTTTTSDPSVPASIRYAVCALQEGNALRVDCAITTSHAADIEITFAPDDDSVAARTQTDGAFVADHSVTLYGLVPATDYTWTAQVVDHPETAVTGSITTGDAPTSVAMDPLIIGTSGAEDQLLFLFSCSLDPYAVLLRPDGRLWWYQALAAGLPGNHHTAQAITYTPEGTVLAIVDNEYVREFDFAGNLLLQLSLDNGDFDRPIHHDVFRRDGYTYLLNAHSEVYPDGEEYVTDGIYVFDAAGIQIAAWDLDDLITPMGGGPPGGYWSGTFPLYAIDFSHANGLYVDEGHQNLYVSFYQLDTILKLGADPTSADFGALRWALAGSNESPWKGTTPFEITSQITKDLTFSAQHHPLILPDGRLQLLDNERGFNAESRVLTLTLDELAGTADIDGSYPMGMTCAFEGGAFRLSNGNVLGTCAPLATFVEFADGSPEPIRQITPRCEQGFFFGYIPRGIPVTL